MDGLSPASSSPRIFWNSRKRSANSHSSERSTKEEDNRVLNDLAKENQTYLSPVSHHGKLGGPKCNLSERRLALFEPLQPIDSYRDTKFQTSAEELPPPDFDSTPYPKGWLVGKKRKLVNIDVVESMRRIAIQEMNRKDREINGLNEQLEEDSKCLEHLQMQLLEERSKRASIERENEMLQNQISMLMNMLQENQSMEEEEEETAAAALPDIP